MDFREFAGLGVGRLDPCPCGSGTVYKWCCEGRRTAPDFSFLWAPPRLELARRSLQPGVRKAWELGESVWRGHSAAVEARLHGLSEEQFRALVTVPLEALELVSLATRLDRVPDAPCLRLFLLLAGEVGEKGLRTTARGNLPRAVVRSLAEAFLGPSAYYDRTYWGEFYKEEDFPELYRFRALFQAAGLVRRYRGRLILSRQARDWLAGGRLDLLYLTLLEGSLSRFDWAITEWPDGFGECPSIRQGAIFSLYVLRRYGSHHLLQRFYEESFMRAFPDLWRDFEDTQDVLREERAARCYTHRTLEYFLVPFGLAEAEPVAMARVVGRDYLVRATPALGDVVHFRFPMLTWE